MAAEPSTADSSRKVGGEPPIRPPPERVGAVVGRIDRILRRHLADQLTPLKLTLPEYTVLSYLDREPGMSGAELARRKLVSPQAINEMIATLEARALIERSVDPQHGRILQMRLSESGSQILAQARASVDALDARLLEGIDEHDQILLIELLWRCAENLGVGLPSAKRL